MTYNTRIYNYANLHLEDKQIIQAQLLMLESVEDTITNYTYAKETSTNILDPCIRRSKTYYLFRFC